MSQENVTPPERPLQEAVDRQTEALDKIGQAINQQGETPLREAVEEHGKAMDEVQRELGRPQAGTLPTTPKTVPEPEKPSGEPGF